MVPKEKIDVSFARDLHDLPIGDVPVMPDNHLGQRQMREMKDVSGPNMYWPINLPQHLTFYGYIEPEEFPPAPIEMKNLSALIRCHLLYPWSLRNMFTFT